MESAHTSTVVYLTDDGAGSTSAQRIGHLDYAIRNVSRLDIETLSSALAVCIEWPSASIPDVGTLRKVSTQCASRPIILITNRARSMQALEAVKDGIAYWYVCAPADPEEFALIVAKACVYAEITRENVALREQFSQPNIPVNLIGESRAMSELRAQVHAIASLDSTVLLTGESGTGKSTIARLVHLESSRAHLPFVALNCAAIPRDLMEAELFGYERGAFTGAVAARRGSVEAAEGGTLFLDEIGDLPLDLQPKLLSFLQDRSVRRIGSNENRSVDVRIITATNQDLDQLRKERRFREDLYYRVNVLRIQIPPLRERKEDIRALALSRLSVLAGKMRRKNLSLSPRAMHALMSYEWPGNVRELENVLERAIAFSSTDVIDVAELALPSPANVQQPHGSADRSVSLRLDELERTALVEALTRAGGDKKEVARLLGVSLKSVYNKLSRYGLS